jgi:general secretion pathway protein G
MAKRTRHSTGFTLVEILIVVVILGILAAIVIPQFTNASEDAKSSSLYTQLQTIRSQLELYQIQHNGNYPSLAQLQANPTAGGTGWKALVDKTNVDETYTGTPEFGPYLQQSARNPFNGKSDVADLGTATDGTGFSTNGWAYNEDTGAIFAGGFNETTGVYADSAP